MATITEVIARLEELRKIYGDIGVKIVNYHSDFTADEIEAIGEAITVFEGYVVIGGESW